MGTKGALNFYKRIPQPKIAESLTRIIETLKVGGRFLLKEVDESILAQAIASIAENMPEGLSGEEDFAALATQEFNPATGETEAYDIRWMTTSDQALTDDLSAIQILQMELVEGGSSGMDLDNLLSLSKQADEVVARTVQHAIQTAEQTCVTDPDVCEASQELLKGFKIVRIDKVAGEISQGAAEVAGSPEVGEAWNISIDKINTSGTQTVTDNPFYDTSKWHGRQVSPGSEAEIFRGTDTKFGK